MLPSASDAAVRDYGEINVVTHSSALFKKGVNIVQLVLILKDKKKEFLEFLSTVHGRATGRLHYIPVNLQILFFLWQIFFISFTKSGENHLPVHLPFSPPPILSSTKIFH